MKTIADVLADAGFKVTDKHKKVKILGYYPRKQQIEMLKSALNNARWGDYSDAGTGKSLTSYLYITALILSGRKVLVVMPPTLCDQYATKFAESVDITAANITMQVYNQNLKQRQQLWGEWAGTSFPNVLVMGYGISLKIPNKQIVEAGYSVFVCDEAHALKDANSKVFNKFKALSTVVTNVRMLMMTGTPAITTPECAYGLIKLISPKVYSSKRAFDFLHLKKFKRITVGYKNLKKISENLYLSAKKITKEEVLDLKKPNIIPVPLIMNKKHKELYRRLLETRIIELENEDDVVAIQSQTLRKHAMQIACDPNKYSDSNIVDVALPRLDEIINSLGVKKVSATQKKLIQNSEDSKLTEKDRKVVVFCWYTDTINTLKGRYKDLNPAVVSGDTNAEENKNKFILDPTCKLIIIQPMSGGTGLDGMQHVCSDIVVFQPFGSAGLFDQCCSRLIRSGQTKAVNVYLFDIKNTLYTKTLDVMVGRAKEQKIIVRKVSDLLSDLIT